ncbi:MAG: hypothetical protein RIC14_01960 [Filomicrobium sp.]
MCADVLKSRQVRHPDQGKGRGKPASTGHGKATAQDVEKRLEGPHATRPEHSPAENSFDTTKQISWTGASGSRYLHDVHTLIGCPEVMQSNYLLVRNTADGNRIVLAAGYANSDAPSLNLAEIRQIGATLGANEVHVHFLARDEKHAKTIAHDLREAHRPGSQPVSSSACH